MKIIDIKARREQWLKSAVSLQLDSNHVGELKKGHPREDELSQTRRENSTTWQWMTSTPAQLHD